MDSAASCPSPAAVEVDGDASQTATWLRNALQIEVVRAIKFTQTCLTIFMGTRIQEAASAPTDIYRPSI
jgi:hypothetical protein